ncbi:hypothetical protein [Streptomyces sp. NPDC059762]|uniref:hypothetical protein n=1 Tax=Streptomyces sp. NPDC059762 TaxID=3346938 RepID=UPI0036499F9A
MTQGRGQHQAGAPDHTGGRIVGQPDPAAQHLGEPRRHVEAERAAAGHQHTPAEGAADGAGAVRAPHVAHHVGGGARHRVRHPAARRQVVDAEFGEPGVLHLAVDDERDLGQPGAEVHHEQGAAAGRRRVGGRGPGAVDGDHPDGAEPGDGPADRLALRRGGEHRMGQHHDRVVALAARGGGGEALQEQQLGGGVRDPAAPDRRARHVREDARPRGPGPRP